MNLEAVQPMDSGSVPKAGRRISRASIALLGSLSILLAATAATAFAGAADHRIAMNLLTGALLGLLLVTSLQLLSDAAGADPLKSLRVGVVGTFVRMALAGAGLWAAATRPWFDPIPFVAAFGLVYFSIGVALVMSQRPGQPVPAGGGAR